MDDKRGWGEGVSPSGPLADATGRMEKHQLVLGTAKSLADLSDEFHFFSPAILYLHGVITDAPLFDFVREMGEPVEFFWTLFRKPVFAGLEDGDGGPGWNHALWAVRLPFWRAFCDFMCSIVVRNRSTGQAWQVGLQELTVVDPVARGVSEAVLAKLSVFGYKGTTRQVALSGDPDVPSLTPPRLTVYEGSAEMRVFSAAVERGVNPHTAVEIYNLSLKKGQM